MKTVIEMARECGINFHQAGWPELERLAELIRADEREKYKWDVHSCGPTCKRYACVAMREAVEAEREACAKVCEQHGYEHYCGNVTDKLAETIRARRNHERN